MTNEPSVLKYVGVYLLATISANVLVSLIMLLPTPETILSSFGFFILAAIEVGVIYFVITFTYSKFLDLDMNKVFPWIIGLMILKYFIVFIGMTSALKVLPNYYILMFIFLLQPVVIFKVLKDHFQQQGRLL